MLSWSWQSSYDITTTQLVKAQSYDFVVLWSKVIMASVGLDGPWKSASLGMQDLSRGAGTAPAAAVPAHPRVVVFAQCSGCI